MAKAIMGSVIEKVVSLIGRNFGEAKGLLVDLDELSEILADIIFQTDKKKQSKEKENPNWLKLLETVACIAGGALDELSMKARPLTRQITSQQVSWYLLYSFFNPTQNFHMDDKGKLCQSLVLKIEEMKEKISGPLAPHLPPHVSQCLSYCFTFPPGYEMKKHELIGLWIANDFVRSVGDEEPEDIADATFTGLLSLSFFQDPTQDIYGNVVACKMHNLVQLLTSSLIEAENSKADLVKGIQYMSMIGKPQPSARRRDRIFQSMSSLFSPPWVRKPSFEQFDVSTLTSLRTLNLSGMSIESLPLSLGDLKHLRYLDLSKNCMTSVPESIHNLGNLQVLDLSENEGITALPLYIGDLKCLRHFNFSQCSVSLLPESILSLTNLRTLDLSRNYSVTTLPFSIGNLQSLRYFNLSECSLIVSLPESLGRLSNLQWLILSGCSSLVQLPESTRDMRGLRHLDIHGCSKVTKMPIGIGKLMQLQTLNLFSVGRPDRDSVCGGIQELQGLVQLRGELEIQGLEHVTAKHAREANLPSKYHLKKLKLSWESVDSAQGTNSKEALEGLELPPNIQQLIINEYPLAKRFPRGILANLSSLKSLQISNCKELVSLPEGLQNLISLEELQIDCCHRIECLPVMGIQNASLVSLVIKSCDSLTSVTKGLLYLTSLKTLSLQHCPQLELETEDFHHLISLLYLRVEWLPKLKALPEGIQHLTMLQQLEIEYCWNLRNLPEGLQCLTFLETLKIHYCPELQLTQGDFQHLVNLEKLTIGFLPKLKALPEAIQHLTILRHLEIMRCENLRSLPEGLKFITALQSLKLRNCHQDLHKRCQKENGEDWHLISHISYRDIDTPPKES